MLEIVRFFDEEEGKDKEFEDEVKVLSSRVRIMDETISALRKGEIKFAMPHSSPMLKLLVEHAQTMFARTVTDKLSQEKREWSNTSSNDLWLALIYWRIAMLKRLKYEPNR